MGKGDKRSRRGKIFRGTFGKSRPHRVKAAVKPAIEKSEVPKPEKKAPKKKAAKKKAEE